MFVLAEGLENLHRSRNLPITFSMTVYAASLPLSRGACYIPDYLTTAQLARKFSISALDKTIRLLKARIGSDLYFASKQRATAFVKLTERTNLITGKLTHQDSHS